MQSICRLSRSEVEPELREVYDKLLNPTQPATAEELAEAGIVPITA